MFKHLTLTKSPPLEWNVYIHRQNFLFRKIVYPQIKERKGLSLTSRKVHDHLNFVTWDHFNIEILAFVDEIWSLQTSTSLRWKTICSSIFVMNIKCKSDSAPFRSKNMIYFESQSLPWIYDELILIFVNFFTILMVLFQ